MDFSQQRSAQQHSQGARVSNGSAPASSGGSSKKGWKGSPMWLRVIFIILLFSGTLLVVSMVLLMYFGSPKESKYVDDDKVQAVFMTNGQVYFGDIKAVNEKYVDLQNIYYLSVNQAVQPKEGQQQNTSITLVKLGCELHGPVDQMIINRDQVTFWENLKSDGQVSEKINEWVEQNPEGLKCNPAS